jgi:hypothetical protein
MGMPNMKKIETDYMHDLMVALGSCPNIRIWRQNTGEVVTRDRTGRPTGVFKAGPPNGAADLSGIVFGSGKRLEIECKRDRGKANKDQENWRAMIERAGGIHVLVHFDSDLTDQENINRAKDLVLRSCSEAENTRP